MTRDAAYWIEKLHLAEHPEGGFFVRTYQAREVMGVECLPDRFPGARPFASSIYYLLKGDQFSGLHRIKSDEIWHFYEGSPLTIYVIDTAGGLIQMRLGRDYDAGERFQAVVRAGCWFGATVDDPGSYCLVGCTVAPGFEYEDFELGEQRELIEQYPQHRSIIMKLTREA